MRDLNEYKAEIFRRSEEKLKKKRRRRLTVLSVCAPLCLIIAVWSVTVLPAMMPAKSAGPGYHPGDGLVGGLTELLSVKISFTADSLETSKSLKGSDRATQIYCEILDIYNEAAVSDTDTDPPKYSDNPGGKDEITFSGENILYKIEFTDSSGEKAQYTLKGNVLCAYPSGHKVLLTGNQLNKLKTMLEITEK
ncbi:MAG: hypothetical protein IKV54_06360 [Clostridia bacterium]|nr:hypothetical protein [Clostridia bacterium]